MKARFIYEKFIEDSDPIEDMGIGRGLIYDIRENPNEEGSYFFKTNNEKIKNLIRKYIQGISDNELNRFWAFTLNDIYDKIPMTYFENKNYKKIDKYIEQSIQAWSPLWMSMHGDKAIKKGIR